MNWIDTSTDTAWSTKSASIIKTYVRNFNNLYADWDIITLQQGSEQSVDLNNYTNSVPQLIAKIIADAPKPPIIAWNINHSRKSADNPSAIVSNCKEMLKYGVSMVFPYGTAIFNARTNDTLKQVGDGGDLWCSDEIHLQEDLPCYIAALANVQAFFNKFFHIYPS